MSHSRPSPDYLATLRRRYGQAGQAERSAMLDEFCKTTGYHRKHAIALLRGKRQHRSGPIRRPRARTYLPEDQRAVLQLAEWFDRDPEAGCPAPADCGRRWTRP